MGQEGQERALALDLDVLAAVVRVFRVKLEVPEEGREGGRE